ncbi:MAG: DUF362 domain-containing protein [Desulfobacterales bacterium]|nr:DUF362 domain-containing protein [Desulfobacterales bacterium]
MTSPVYFIDLRATYQENVLNKLGRLMETAGLSKCLAPRDLVAVKLHFGEPGCTAFVRPVFVRKIVSVIKENKGDAFLTDANTLYVGKRSLAPEHLTSAVQNGFSYSVVEAPLIIADGLRGSSETAEPVSGKHFKRVYIGAEIANADALVSVAHFKGHELTGFGGALKNIGMGSASRRGKLAQHAAVAPKIKPKKCVGCGDCVVHCVSGAISLVKKKAVIDPEKCIGCGQCIIVCPNEAPAIQWDASMAVFQEKMIEYAWGVLNRKKNKVLCLNFLTDISPACDCVPLSDAPIVKNIGVLASTDPVAIDQASADLVNGEPALAGTCLEKNHPAGADKFKGLYPEINWEIQLDYAEKMGLGTRTYQLNKI